MKIIIDVWQDKEPKIHNTCTNFVYETDVFLRSLSKRKEFQVVAYQGNKTGYKKITFNDKEKEFYTSKGERVPLCEDKLELFFDKIPKVISYKVIPIKKKKK